MNDLVRIWDKVESIPFSAAVLAEWQEATGGDFPALQPFLTPEKGLAETYPCPDPGHEGCPRRVIRHSPGDIVAVCGNAPHQCETLHLSQRDIVAYTLKSREWSIAVADGLRRTNGLVAGEIDTPEGVVPVGFLQQRLKRVPIVWLRNPQADFEGILRGLRSPSQVDGLIGILPPGVRSPGDRLFDVNRVLLTAPPAGNGDLALWRGLDLLDPGYRKSRAGDPSAIFDDVRIELAEEPGVRHVVRIDGRDVGGFQKSDLRFLRLLLLAAARKQDPDVDGGGWVEKFRLQGDEKDHDLEDLRVALRTADLPGLNSVERGALIKGSPSREGQIRLAVAPALIDLDASLAAFKSIGHKQSLPSGGRKNVKETPGQEKRAGAFVRQRKVAKALLREAAGFGAPVKA